jgi:hypothetical protein
MIQVAEHLGGTEFKLLYRPKRKWHQLVINYH